MSGVTGKRKSRFESSDDLPNAKRISYTEPQAGDGGSLSAAAAAAAAKAAEISRDLSNKIALVSSIINTTKLPTVGGGSSFGIAGTASVMPNLGGMASVLPGGVNKEQPLRERKATYMPLLLDDQGREVDQYGNVVKRDTQVKTLAANKAVEKSKQKKNNPYLAHRKTPQAVVDDDAGAEEQNEEMVTNILDDRVKTARRDIRGKKSLKFVEAGKFLKEADELKAKEERKLIAGYASGRKALQQTEKIADEDQAEEVAPEGGSSAQLSEEHIGEKMRKFSIPAASDGLTSVNHLPSVEWWDEPFLPKAQREELRSSKQQSTSKDAEVWYNQMALQNARTHKLVQHPVPCRPLNAAADQKRQEIVLPTYLTKRERKKLRRATRQERELEKRDKMMMGLIPAPEPKFKLSNFMKVLGDQAVADPSKVEMKVMEQMQQRVLNHEMRNQAAKLTPQERKEKKTKKLQELDYISLHGVQVAVFRVRNFSNLKFRFKVDVNAQQHFLSGTVLFCCEGLNLVVAEGGPKGINKFVRLMLERIKWNEADTSSNNLEEDADESDDDNEHDSDNDSQLEGDGVARSQNGDSTQQHSSSSAYGTHNGNSSGRTEANSCDLLWRGNMPKRAFVGFKFQESKNSAAARKMLKARGVEHFWDMVENADNIIASSEIAALL